VKHHSAPHKNHPFHQNASSNQPGALKNTTGHKSLPQKISPQNPQVRASLASASANKSSNQDRPKPAADSLKEKSTVQATERAILVHNANSGEGHVVQDSASGKAPVIVINSDTTGDNGGSLDAFSQDCLDAHNNYRAKHGVPPLMWSHDLAEGAQSWADQLASTDSLQHDQAAIQNRKIGENLAYFQPSVPKCQGAMVDNCVNCREMVQRWYDEVKNYDFDKGGPKTAAAPYKHFSQLIWANTAEVGVGTAVSKRYGFITVARYRPTGNDGDFEEFIRNVPPEGGPLPTMSPPLEDESKPLGDVPTPTPVTETPVVSATKVDSTSSQTANSKQDKSTDVTVLSQTEKSSVTNGAIISAKTAAKVPAAPLQKDKSTDVTVLSQMEKSSSTNGAVIPAKTTATVPAAPLQKGAKLETQSTSGQPNSKGTHGKGGFVHTLTANDGTKAQVYLSKSGAHAGIVFRNKISRVNEDEDSTGVKRTINVL